MSNSGSTRGCLSRRDSLSLSLWSKERKEPPRRGKEGNAVGKGCWCERLEQRSMLRWMPLVGLVTTCSGIQWPWQTSLTVVWEAALSVRAIWTLGPHAGTSFLKGASGSENLCGKERQVYRGSALERTVWVELYKFILKSFKVIFQTRAVLCICEFVSIVLSIDPLI